MTLRSVALEARKAYLIWLYKREQVPATRKVPARRVLPRSLIELMEDREMMRVGFILR